MCGDGEMTKIHRGWVGVLGSGGYGSDGRRLMALAGASPSGDEFVGWAGIKDPFNVGPKPGSGGNNRWGIVVQSLFGAGIGIKVQAIGPIAMPR